MRARTWSTLLLLQVAAALLLLCGSGQAEQQQHRALLQARSLLAEHRFKQGDAVPLWVSKTGPFSNPRCGWVAWGRRAGRSKGRMLFVARGCSALCARAR